MDIDRLILTSAALQPRKGSLVSIKHYLQDSMLSNLLMAEDKEDGEEI
jgi:hypothetical protein